LAATEVDEPSDWPDGMHLWTARALLHIKEHLEAGLSEEALPYVDNRFDHPFTIGSGPSF